MRRTDKLTERDWRDAAVRALARGGVAAVAVEPLARELGATKGSFYWHFSDRAGLLRAALAEWEARSTEDVIQRLAAIADPRARLRELFHTALRTREDGAIYLALSAAAGDGTVRAALARVARRRVAFLADCYQEMGAARAESLRRARLAYAAYLGLMLIERDTSERLDARERSALIDQFVTTLI
jgi:AcrR family transcriptional regulator